MWCRLRHILLNPGAPHCHNCLHSAHTAAFLRCSSRFRLANLVRHLRESRSINPHECVFPFPVTRRNLHPYPPNVTPSLISPSPSGMDRMHSVCISLLVVTFPSHISRLGSDARIIHQRIPTTRCQHCHCCNVDFVLSCDVMRYTRVLYYRASMWTLQCVPL